MTRHSRCAAVILAALVVGSGSAHAQQASSGGSFSAAIAALKAGQRISVTDADGKRTKGRIERLSGGEFTIDDRTFRETDIRTIRTVGDSKWNGALIGAGLGGAVGAIGASTLGEYNSDGVGPMIGFGIAAGAGFGALADSFINGPVTVFDSTKTKARLIPMIGPRRGVLVSLRY